jgi:hypothetical protein
VSTVVDKPENAAADPVDDRNFCSVHTTVETTLRCNKCGRYMCVKCAVRTPVGYRCKQCVHEQQDVYFSASQIDYIIAGAVSLALTIPAAFIASKLGFFLIILLGLPVGGFIGEAVHRATGKRRGRYTWQVVAACIVIGALLAAIPEVVAYNNSISELQSRGIELSELRGNIAPSLFFMFVPSLIFIVLAVGGAVARLRYGK